MERSPRCRSRADYCRSYPSEPFRSRCLARDGRTRCSAQELDQRRCAGLSKTFRFDRRCKPFSNICKARKRVAITTFGLPEVTNERVPRCHSSVRSSSARESAQNGDLQRTLVPERSAVPWQAVHREKDGPATRRRDQDPVSRREAMGPALATTNSPMPTAGSGAKFTPCRPRHRCGSSACPKCARAFQRAKVAAEETIIAALTKSRPNKHLVFVTIVPRHMTYLPGQFSQIDVLKANRRLRDVFHRHEIRRVIIGSVDLGWEKRRSSRYLQLHWHLAMWTTNFEGLEAKLKVIFLRAQKYERPVDVRITRILGFLGYKNKIVKLPKLLRHARRQLAELSLLLIKLSRSIFYLSESFG